MEKQDLQNFGTLHLANGKCLVFGEGRLFGDVAQLVRASDRHAADAGSTLRCGKKFFFSQSQLSVQTLLRSPCPFCAIACIYICAHVKGPVVHVRVGWIMET